MALRREWTDGAFPVLNPRGLYSTSGIRRPFREPIHNNMVNLKTAVALGLTVGRRHFGAFYRRARLTLSFSNMLFTCASLTRAAPKMEATAAMGRRRAQTS